MMCRRARPLLGTLVEVRGDARRAADFDRAADAAFEAIAEVHRLMSFHEAASDVRRIARARPGEHVRVHARTAAVLRHSLRWSRASRGAFEPACGRRAVASGWLPAPEDAAGARDGPTGGTPPVPAVDLAPAEAPAVDVALTCALAIDGRDVRVRTPTWLDLGGIAKGYAVDRAVNVLRRLGVASGVVNAGGDLRVFGPCEETIHVRSPFDPSRLWPVAELREAACATSASGCVLACGVGVGVDLARDRDRDLDHDPDHDEPAAPRSVTVIAPTACAADALTKIVWLRGRAAAALLRRSRAHAFVVQADGAAWRL
jgi:thiamine biosynthesis lipoprotein